MSLVRELSGMAGSVVARIAGRRLLILTYHRVLPEPDELLPGEPYREVFEEHMRVLNRHFHPVALEQGLEQLRAGTLPPRAVAVTFDDGYTDNLMHALPILQKYRVPGICFVATDYLSGGCMFNDRIIDAVRRMEGAEIDAAWLGLGRLSCHSTGSRRNTIDRILGALKYQPPAERVTGAERVAASVGIDAPEGLMMSASQVRALDAGGMSLGAHTCSHPILKCVSHSQAQREIGSSRAALERLLEKPIRLFAYPNGRRGQDFTDRDVAEVRAAGFSFALTTDWACATSSTDPLLLPRINVAGYRGAALGLRLGRYFFE